MVAPVDEGFVIGIRLTCNQTDRSNDLLGFGKCQNRFSVSTVDANPCGDCNLTRKIAGNPETPNLPVFSTFIDGPALLVKPVNLLPVIQRLAQKNLNL